MRTRRFRLAVLALGGLVLLGASAAAIATTRPAKAANAASDQTIKWDRYLELGNFDVQSTPLIDDIPILDLVYEPLVSLNDQNKVVPWLAKSYRQMNARTYLFQLRPGVRFSNGRRITAADVVFSVKRLFDPKQQTQYAPLLGSLSSVTATGPMSVKIVLKASSAGFLRGMTQSEASVLPATEFKNHTYDPTKDMLGTGPFVLVQHTHNVSWTFKRNPRYWRAGYPKASGVVIKYVPNDAARMADLRDGNAGIADFATPHAGKLLSTIPNVRVTQQENDEVYTLLLNGSAKTPNPALRNVKVREAINMALDPQQIIDQGFGGAGRISTAAPPFLPNACPESQMLQATGSKAKATQLLKQAGYAHFTLHLYSLTQYPNLTAAAQVMQQQLEAIGINVKLIVIDAGVFGKTFGAGKTEATSLGLGLPVDTAPFLKAWFDPATGRFATNMAPDRKVSAAIDAANAAPTAKQGPLIRRACRLIDQSSSMIPTATVTIAVAVRKDLLQAHIRNIDFGTPYSDIASFVVR